MGGLLGKLCDEERIAWEYGNGRLEDRRSLLEDTRRVRPTHVLSATGVIGRPNVNWCASHKVETIRTNVVGTLTLADVCREQGLYMMNFATGCIFEYDEKHPLGSGIGFKEEDKPNFTGSFYSKAKAMAKVIIALRSNNEMDASKLKQEFPGLLPIKDSIIKNVFERNKKT